MSRPELTGHASLYYNAREAKKYDTSSRMMGVQREITERAIELLRLPNKEKPCHILDVGCGSGLSGRVLEEQGHFWVGLDVSRDMLDVANERILEETEEEEEAEEMNDDEQDNDEEEDYAMEEEEEDESNNKNKNNNTMDFKPKGDLMHHDMGTGLPFRPSTFDGCISISALQWLCYSNSNGQIPKRRLLRFFSSLYQVLRRGARAVLQFYPETAEQAILISECASRVGFAGGIVVDYPNSAKAKKHYLVLSFDRAYKAPQGLTAASATGTGLAQKGMVRTDDDDGEQQRGNKKKKPKVHKKKRGGIKTKDWILQKKEMQRKKGKTVRPDSKYTGRKRPTKF